MYPIMLTTPLTSDAMSAICAYADLQESVTTDFDKITDADVRAALLTVSDFVKTSLLERMSHYSNDPLYSAGLQLVRGAAGYAVKLRADRENYDRSPHPTPWRAFTAVTVLNADFTGGELHFPNQTLVVKPIPGVAVVFPSGLECVYGVDPVKTGVRYALVSFLTYDAAHADVLTQHN